MGIQKLGENLKAMGDGFRFVDLSHVQGAERRRVAHAEMLKSRPTHVILISPDTSLFAGVSRHHVKIGSMFGNLRSKRVIRLGVRYGYLVDVALKQLIPLGHRHFMMPFLDRKVKMTRNITDIMRIAKEHGVRIDVKLSSQPLTTENMGRLIGSGLEQGVTAVLFPQWTDFMPAIGYFAGRGLEFPRDLSVVSLVCLPVSRLYVPAVAGFLSSPDSITQQSEDWIYTDQLKDDAFRMVYEKTWDSGASIGPAPKR
jgi:DNA-binding LacI/PurR family transcriptional regulator